MEAERRRNELQELLQKVDEEQLGLDEAAAEHVILARKRQEAQADRDRLLARRDEALAALERAKTGFPAEIRLYQDKLVHMIASNRQALARARKEAENSRKERAGAWQSELDTLADQVRDLKARRVRARANANRRLKEIKDLHARNAARARREGVRRALDAARKLKGDLDKAVAAAGRGHGRVLQSLAASERDLCSRVEERHRRLLEAANQDQRRMQEPRTVMLETLRAEWAHRHAAVRAGLEGVREARAQLDGTQKYVDQLRSHVAEMRERLARAEEQRSELREWRGRQLVREDELRIETWRKGVLEQSLRTVAARRDKLYKMLSDLRAEIRAKRRTVSSQVTRMLDETKHLYVTKPATNYARQGAAMISREKNAASTEPVADDGPRTSSDTSKGASSSASP